MNKDDQYHVRTVDRALSILKLFIDHSGEISLTEISRKVQLNQSTAYRLLSTMISSGFIEQSPQTGRYRLGVGALALGEAFLRNNDLFQRAHPELVELRDCCGETVHLAVLDGIEVVYLDKLPGLHAIGLMSSRIGGRAPSYCTGVGKMLLAHLTVEQLRSRFQEYVLKAYTSRTITTLDGLIAELSKIRADGYAIDQEEHEPGVACIAAPIFNHRGMAAVISVSGPSDRIMKAFPQLSPIIVQTAAKISTLLGGSLNSHASIPPLGPSAPGNTR